jgi:hypothetical protein
MNGLMSSQSGPLTFAWSLPPTPNNRHGWAGAAGVAALTGLRKSGSVACKPSWLLVSDIARDSMRVEARGEAWLLTLRADLALSERGEQ